MLLSLDSLTDFLLVTWITTSLVLLSQFGWYAARVWQEASLREVQTRLSFFHGLIIHHLGNLVLLLWFWTKLHHNEIYIVSNSADAWVIVSGSVLAISGVFYKIRIFSYSGWETAATIAAVTFFGAVSVLALHKHWL